MFPTQGSPGLHCTPGWPSEDPECLQMIAHTQEESYQPTPTASDKQTVITILDQEVAKCDKDMGVDYDICIFDRYPSQNNKFIGMVLTTLYYRGRIQSTLLDVFLMLVQRGFLQLDSLKKPITLRKSSPNCRKVSFLLTTFEALAKEEEYNVYDRGPWPLWDIGPTYEALDWLATMIVRGCANIDQLFDTILISGYLGGVNKERFERYKTEQIDKEFVCNEDERARQKPATRPNNDFVFWLPHGLGNMTEREMGEDIATRINRFNEIERAYKAFYGVPDSLLVTADQQAQYLDRNPDKCQQGLREYLQNEAEFRRCSGQGHN